MGKTAATIVPDNILVEAYLHGSVLAFSQLVERHQAKVYTAIYLLVKEKFLAEDIMQETFIKIVNHIHEGKYREEGKFLPWALRIARNLCLDHFRKQKRSTEIRKVDSYDVLDFMASQQMNAEERIVMNERYAELMAALKKLPEEQQDVIVLRHFTGLSFKDIAAITGCSVNTALGRMRYAVINLRRELPEHNYTRQAKAS